MVQINGETVLQAEGKSLEVYLTETGYNLQRIVVERNREIVPKNAYGQTMIADGDVIEILNFVGGG